MTEIVFWAWAISVSFALTAQLVRQHKTETELQELENEFLLFKMKTNLELDDEEEMTAVVDEVNKEKEHANHLMMSATLSAHNRFIEGLDGRVAKLRELHEALDTTVQSLSDKLNDVENNFTWAKLQVDNADQKADDVLLQTNELSYLVGELSAALAQHKEQNTSYHISIGKKVSDIAGEIEKLKQVPSK